MSDAMNSEFNERMNRINIAYRLIEPDLELGKKEIKQIQTYVRKDEVAVAKEGGNAIPVSPPICNFYVFNEIIMGF